MDTTQKIVVETHALSSALELGLREDKFLYITASAGWGKTAAVRHHFRARRHTYASFWDEDALEQASHDDSGLVILDDCQLLAGQPELQNRLRALLRNVPPDKRVLLLSRAPLPAHAPSLTW